MPIESLTYTEISERLGVSPEAARALAKRKRWQRQLGNDGKARVIIDLSDVRPPSDTPVVPRTTALLAQIEALQTEITRLQYELSKSEGTAAGHRADYERERDRCDRLVAELGVISARIAAWPLPGRRSWWRWLRSAA